MRSVLLAAAVLCANAVLVAGTARGEWLFAEITNHSENVGPQNSVIVSGPTSSGFLWSYYPSSWPPLSQYGKNWRLADVTIGVPSRKDIETSGFTQLNDVYYEFDESNFALARDFFGHHFWMSTLTGGVIGGNVPLHKLFTSGTYGSLVLTSHFTPPNGMSFVGTNYRFTAVEFTLDNVQDLPDPNLPGAFKQIVDFTVRFYGVPEPGTLTLIMVCAVMAPLATGRTARSR